ncbi:hypothetical protein GWI33_019281 [Rhynchophorus ferrugineus]|uniref:Uncharacterized protein n=1 Tax=Rhynchophorus ferrugineus TaxID=354439 RepID=A0A834HV26_RHYFE|nr:hypothetical protein GWI33_019281 [Rhynchophorus ferrugineus]
MGVRDREGQGREVRVLPLTLTSADLHPLGGVGSATGVDLPQSGGGKIDAAVSRRRRRRDARRGGGRRGGRTEKSDNVGGSQWSGEEKRPVGRW